MTRGSMIKILISAVSVLALVCLLNGPSQGAEIDAVELVHRPELSVSFRVKDAFNENIEEAVNSGVPTSFAFRVELARVRGLWFDKGSGGWEFRRTVKYDTLRQEYEVTMDEAGENVVRTRDAVEMKRLMTTGTAIRLALERPLVEGAPYRLRIKAELHTVRLPLFLDY